MSKEHNEKQTEKTMTSGGFSRRSVLAGAASAGALGAMSVSASSYARILGANDRANVAIMGARSRGRGLAKSFANSGRVNITDICDVDSRVLTDMPDELVAAGFKRPSTQSDVRDTLAKDGVDVLVIATPDHWHAPAGVMALSAGKHVYVEKPCSHNPREGELFIEAQKKYGKVVQMGNQQRSSPETMELMQAIADGELGEVYRAYTWYANDRESIGNGQSVTPPEWLDWDLWQGPAPRRDYHDNYVHYNWHWFWHWGTGELCNNGAHELDIARWALGGGFPEKVSVNGARRFHTDDDWEFYDTIEARYEFPGDKVAIWEGHSCNRVKKFGRGRGTLIYGTKGHAIVDRGGYELYDISGDLIRENNAPSGNNDTNDLVGAGRLTDLHIANFLDAVTGKDVSQNSPIMEAHQSTYMCLAGNIAYRIGKDLACDTSNGHFADDEAMALWGRTYQPGWEPKV